MSTRLSAIKCPVPSLSQPWRLVLPAFIADPEQSIHFDEQLLQRLIAGEGDPCFCIKRDPRCLVVTRREARFSGFKDARRALESAGWPVVVRCSGGSCVPQGAGVLNLSLVFPKPEGWMLEDGYWLLCGIFTNLLQGYGLKAEQGEVPGSFCDGRYNLQVEGRKLLGTAQRWAGSNRQHSVVMAHACLLVDPDLAETTAAVNRFYRLCGQSQQFEPRACTTLTECLGRSRDGTLMDDVTSRLTDLLTGLFDL